MYDDLIVVSRLGIGKNLTTTFLTIFSFWGLIYLCFYEFYKSNLYLFYDHLKLEAIPILKKEPNTILFGVWWIIYKHCPSGGYNWLNTNGLNDKIYG